MPVVIMKNKATEAKMALQQFIEKLETMRELKRIPVPVSPQLEITEITDRVSKNGGPALLFEKVEGYEYPILINAFGSIARMNLALNAPIDDIAAKIERLLKTGVPSTLKEKLKMLFTLKDIASYLPKTVKTAPCKHKVYTTGALLDRLPIQTCWPQDGGPFITLPLVITKDPDTGIQNIGMYRMQKYSNTQTGMHWHYNKDGARHYRKYNAAQKRMPVAVALGGAPTVTYSATAPLPPDIPELVLAGFLEGNPIETVKCETNDLLVPAESDFVIEGYIDPNDQRIEGPFGDHTGFYSAQDMYPVFNVTCITARENAVYPSTIVGRPPMEDCYMAKATERIFLPVLKMIIPEICDINLPIEGVFHNCILVSIDKNYAGQAQKVIHALWGLGQMSSAKSIVIFDKDVNLNDSSHVLWKLYNNVDPLRDMIITQGPLDALDHSASFANYGGKIGIDATRKFKEEGMNRDWPDEIKMNDDIKALVNKRWKEYGF